MTSRRLSLLLAWWIAANVALIAQQAAGTVSGRVVTTDANPQPIRGATVRLIGVGRTAVTDDSGAFEFAGLAPGRYTVVVEKPAYITTQFGAVRTGGPGTPVAVAASRAVRGLVVRLPRGAVISGVVRGIDGQPVPNLAVMVTPGGQASQVLTDDRGEYRIFGLLPGDYLVQASPRVTVAGVSAPSTADVDARLADVERRFGRGRGSIVTPAGGSVPARGTTGPDPTPPLTGYSIVYFPGTVRAEQAAPVSIAEGEERNGVDFPLVLAGTSRITGVVVGPEGAPVPRTMLSISTAASTTIESLRPRITTSPTERDGQFVVVNVAPGHYTLSARVNASVSPAALANGLAQIKPDLWGTVEVDALDTDTTGIVIQLRPAVTLSGRLVFDSRTGTRPDNIAGTRLELISPGSASNLLMTSTRRATVRADGAFEIGPFIPGEFQIASSLIADGAGWWLQSATASGHDLLDAPLDFSVIGSITDAVLTFTDRHTQLSGTLQHAPQVPAPEYTIVVFPADRRLWNAARRMRNGRPATDGAFEFTDLPAGEYLLAALTDVDASGWRNPAFLEGLVSASVRVAIRPGETTRQDLAVKRSE